MENNIQINPTLVDCNLKGNNVNVNQINQSVNTNEIDNLNELPDCFVCIDMCCCSCCCCLFCWLFFLFCLSN